MRKDTLKGRQRQPAVSDRSASRDSGTWRAAAGTALLFLI